MTYPFEAVTRRIEGMDDRIEGVDDRIEGVRHHLEGMCHRIAREEPDGIAGYRARRRAALEAHILLTPCAASFTVVRRCVRKAARIFSARRRRAADMNASDPKSRSGLGSNGSARMAGPLSGHRKV